MDAYTIKKFLPRIFIAVILANLSLPLIEVLVQFVNALGTSVEAILREAMPVTVDAVGSNAGFLGAATGIALGAGLAGLAIGGWAAMLPAALSILLALFIVYVIVIVRRILILLLIVLAPIAIAMWAIPGLDKWAGRWFKLLLQLLLVYPIIIALISSGAFVASLIQGSGDNNVNFGQSMAILVAILAPYFLIPTVFKMASSTLANITGAINNRSKGLIDRSKQLRANKFKQNWEQTKAGNRFKTNKEAGLRAGLNKRMQTATLLPQAGLSRKNWRSNIDTARSLRNFDLASEFLEKDAAAQAIKNDDDKLWAVVHGGDSDESIKEQLLKRAPGRFTREDPITLDNAVAEIKRFKKAAGSAGGPGSVASIAAVRAQAGTGTGYNYNDNVEDDMVNDLIAASGNDRGLAGRMLAEMRGAANQSGRVDLGGGGFAKSMQIVDKRREALANREAGRGEVITKRDDDGYVLDTNGNRVKDSGLAPATEIYTEAEARTEMLTDVLRSNAGAAVAGKKRAVEELAPVMLQSAHAAVTGADADAAARELASLAGKYDAASQVAPQNAEVLATRVLGQKVRVSELHPDMQAKLAETIEPTLSYDEKQVPDPTTGGTRTVRTPVKGEARTELTYQQIIEGLRNDDDFRTMRREYGSAAQDAASRAAGADPTAGLPDPTAGPR